MAEQTGQTASVSVNDVVTIQMSALCQKTNPIKKIFAIF